MNRKLILHIGHAKTGTTKLQNALVASQAVLSAQGILHPSTAPHKNNHRKLIPYLLAPEGEERTSGELREAADLWQKTVREIDRTNPHTVVISSEQLFRPWKPSQMEAMISKLHAVATHITVVAYIREPASLMLSLLQQRLKSHALPTTGLIPPNPRSALEAYQSAGFDALIVKAFDRDVLAGGSVVQDFFENCLPAVKVSDLVVSGYDNSSISAEAMAVLQDIRSGRLNFHIGKPQREVRRADKHLGGFLRPQMLPEVRDAVYASYEHFDWLSDTFDIKFPGIEVTKTDPDAARALLAEVKAIEDVCTVNTARKLKLWQNLSRPDAMLRRLFRPA